MRMKAGMVMLAGSLVVLSGVGGVHAQGVGIPAEDWGIGFGNSERFTGLRFNFRDHGVEEIRGLNCTLWDGYENEESTVRGVSFGLIPSGGILNGLGFGLLGVSADREMNGIGFGFLGVGAGEGVQGIALGGLGCGTGGSATGILAGGLGAGAGEDVTGVVVGGLGAGAGGDLTGIGFGLLGVGAGGDVTGVVVGGLGAGAGGDVTGVVVGGLGAGAGGSARGIVLGGLGAGAPEVTGLVGGLLGVGGQEITGATLALGMVKVGEEGEGRHTGFSVSAVNWIDGSQSGLSVGVVNMARRLHGVQIGLINIVHENPRWARVMPLVNLNL